MWYDMAIHGIVWMMHLNRASIRYHQISIDFCETKKFEKREKKGNHANYGKLNANSHQAAPLLAE